VYEITTRKRERAVKHTRKATMMGGKRLLTNSKSPSKMDTVAIVRRDDFFDIFINDKKCGSGTWAYYYTAVHFFRLEGMEVKVYE
jgi:hypothetical protein